VEENPLHAELIEIAHTVRHDFMLDVTLTRAREISGVFAGEPVRAHAAGVAAIRAEGLQQLDEPLDAVITSAAGHPLDLTFYQTIKGVTAAQHIVKPGGPILVLAECGEGIGSPEFAQKLHGFRGYQEYLDEIAEAPVGIDQWQLEKLALVGLRNPVRFFAPGANTAAMGAMARDCYDDAQTAVAQLVRGLPDDAKIAVIPDGPYVFARVREPAAAMV
jgi:nickel-dependent lactate racemase